MAEQAKNAKMGPSNCKAEKKNEMLGVKAPRPQRFDRRTGLTASVV